MLHSRLGKRPKAWSMDSFSQVLTLQTSTKEPVFFISYATFWCGNERPETAVNILYQDAHAPREGFAFSRSGSIIAGP